MYFKYEKNKDDIVILTMDQPGRSANLMGREFQTALAEVVGRLQAEKPLTGVVVTSAKKTFMAGGDLESLLEMQRAEEAFELVESLKGYLRTLETLGVPVVAAINGTALGGGCEVVLACHHRIAINDRSLRVGMPEVTLGLLPGGGGVTRLPRMLGIQAALPLLLEGRTLDPPNALAQGLIDELADDADDLMAKSLAWIAQNPAAQQPWDAKVFTFPGGTPLDPRVTPMLTVAPGMVLKKTRGNYPAPEAILAVVVEGALVDFDTACRIESRYFASLVANQVSKNMISAFWFQMNAVNGGGSRPDGFAPAQVEKLGIIGAGMMGAAIAYCAAVASIDVVLKDVSTEAAAKGKAYTDQLLSAQVAKKRMNEAKKAAILARIVPSADAEAFQGCDLVIEAVFENRELKAKVTAEAEAHLAPEAVYASNTSTLPITGLAEASSRPQNFIGLHFFSPVDKMPLVEIIVGKKTAPQTVAKAFDFVKQIKKTPIVVNDSRGFYTSRVFATYLLEGISLLAEGQNPSTVEQAGLQAGMPVGPLALTDEVSLSLVHSIRQQTVKDFAANGEQAPSMAAYDLVEKMVESHKRLGKAAGKGFYEYPEKGGKHLWPGLGDLAAQGVDAMPLDDMKDRLMFTQALETVRCLDEGVLNSVADANVGSILGWGFAPFKGGSLQFINDRGLQPFVERARELAAAHGDRFIPPESLVARAQRGEEYR